MAFICRIDKKRTHAWQVRGSGRRGYHSKMFSDGIYGSRDHALAVAKQYAAKIQKPRRLPFRTFKLRNNTSGVNGVYRSHTYQGQTGKRQEYWAAFVSIGPDGHRYVKRFYINDERDDEEAFDLAVEFRQMWERAATIGEKAIQQFFKELQ